MLLLFLSVPDCNLGILGESFLLISWVSLNQCSVLQNEYHTHPLSTNGANTERLIKDQVGAKLFCI